ncbi:hypothetical protein DYB25_008160 [Aphanomyces astaci]|uniref:B box-type domain-containing protein n=1 Tax=Aphanomyces astaci TaxID=112090 RepID=A0A397C1M5_APHAT|nr:hypothetical protein DYB25_008160 [Aphanomyces astaci]
MASVSQGRFILVHAIMSDRKGLYRLRRLSELLDHSDEEDDDSSMDVDVHVPASQVVGTTDVNAVVDNEEELDASVCVECRHQAAEVFCEQCHDHFCRLCYGGQHRKGNRKAHTFQPILHSAIPSADKDDAVVAAAPSLHESSRLTEGDDSSSDEAHDDSSTVATPSSRYFRGTASRKSICNLMGSLFLGSKSTSTTTTSSTDAPSSSSSSSSMRDRAKYIPLRLTYEERKRLRTLEAALNVCHYTDKVDAAMNAPAKRTRMQLQEIAGFLSGLVVSIDYTAGQTLLDEKQFDPLAGFFGELFELGRRYKIMNPEKMRGEYGILMYLLQDAVSPAIQDLLGFSPIQPLKTVYALLEAHDSLGLLDHPLIDVATMVVAPDNRNKSRAKIQQQIKAKDQAIRTITHRFVTATLRADDIQQCLYSIADNNYHLYFERDPIDRMITLLRTHFSPDITNDDSLYSLAIVSGSDGARLSHTHTRQYHYVLQSLTLWREIAHDMFRLWCLTDEDLLSGSVGYQLTDTGQGLHRIQPSPLISRAMHVLLHSTQAKLDHWVGSSVIHLGDKNVPNALMFIDKYAQVGHILRPIVRTLDEIDKLVDTSAELRSYVQTSFGGPDTLKKDILVDFFREAFDGSGADNFFDAGSCIDGRLTSAWNWCSRLHAKPFFPIFKLAGFVGFDGKFG